MIFPIASGSAATNYNWHCVISMPTVTAIMVCNCRIATNRKSPPVRATATRLSIPVSTT